jgi:hypothetical protein
MNSDEHRNAASTRKINFGPGPAQLPLEVDNSLLNEQTTRY